MLDSCLKGSFNSKEAAEELQLHGQALNLTIARTGRPEIRTRSGRVERIVTNLKHMFLSPLQAHVVDNIAGDTLAIHCLELNDKRPHLRNLPFDNETRRQEIDIMIGRIIQSLIMG